MSDDSSPKYDVIKPGYRFSPTLHACLTSYLGDESSDTKTLSTALHIFRLDHSPEIRLGLSITVLEKKMKSDSRVEKK